MMGFRYRCQQCHGYQLCQSCFWRGHANGPHSNQHQMKEHSSWVRGKGSDYFSVLHYAFPISIQLKSQYLFGLISTDFMTQQPCAHISRPFRQIQQGFNEVLLILANKIVLTAFTVLLPPKLNHYVINWNMGSLNPFHIPLGFYTEKNDCSCSLRTGMTCRRKTKRFFSDIKKERKL